MPYVPPEENYDYETPNIYAGAYACYEPYYSFHRLEAVGLSRIVDHIQSGFVVLSAFTDFEDPNREMLESGMTDEEILERRRTLDKAHKKINILKSKELEGIIRGFNKGFIPINGVYFSPVTNQSSSELSFLVPYNQEDRFENFDEFISYFLYKAHDFKQESILVKPPASVSDKIYLYFCKGGRVQIGDEFTFKQSLEKFVEENRGLSMSKMKKDTQRVFAGVFKCPECGSPMEYKDTNTKQYYQCINHKCAETMDLKEFEENPPQIFAHFSTLKGSFLQAMRHIGSLGLVQWFLTRPGEKFNDLG